MNYQDRLLWNVQGVNWAIDRRWSFFPCFPSHVGVVFMVVQWHDDPMD